MYLLSKQYELIKSSRLVMLAFIEMQASHQFISPIAEFNGSNLRYLLVHTANTYKHWLGNFGLCESLVFTNENEVKDIQAIRELYTEVDELVNTFLERFASSIEEPVINQLRGKELTLTPLQLFTHVITHEFHHKGQLMTMCRLLGHIPPDTDVIRT
jgi:uncharacterized damage-inducible protein DinB